MRPRKSDIEFKKLKAFTIMEMMIVLAISAVIVGLAFSVMNLVSATCRDIAGNYQRGQREELLVNRLTIDLNQYNNNQISKGQITFYSPMDTVRYFFKKNQILGETLNGQQDTLSMEIRNLSFFYKGNSISEGYFDAFKIEFEDRTFFISKPNALVENF